LIAANITSTYITSHFSSPASKLVATQGTSQLVSLTLP